ncbi:MAG: AbrB/MazE/SpoVT family DNA-binding domain-containing protein [Thaumarchaeota archaeon]|nr:AbrB/MazE/SpoVT family DNA-binding domain-containing protein [Nitrososphaerota archaeon]
MLVEEEMKVGPKGQVVIPRVFRSALKISPGTKVIVRLENERVVLEKKKMPNAADEFERIAKRGRSVSKLSPHLYEEELEKRL